MANQPINQTNPGPKGIPATTPNRIITRRWHPGLKGAVMTAIRDDGVIEEVHFDGPEKDPVEEKAINDASLPILAHMYRSLLSAIEYTIAQKGEMVIPGTRHRLHQEGLLAAEANNIYEVYCSSGERKNKDESIILVRSSGRLEDYFTEHNFNIIYMVILVDKPLIKTIKIKDVSQFSNIMKGAFFHFGFPRPSLNDIEELIKKLQANRSNDIAMNRLKYMCQSDSDEH